MKIIDLSTKIYDKMPVFPGDPEVSVVSIDQEIEGNPWYMKQLTLCSHDATHVNVPSHIEKGLSSLDDFSLESFFGEAILFENKKDLQEGVGIVFGTRHEFTMELAELAVARKVKFVALAKDFNLDVERYTLKERLISFERVQNTDYLPKNFQFFGVPLKIEAGDGSPVRAFAIVD